MTSALPRLASIALAAPIALVLIAVCAYSIAAASQFDAWNELFDSPGLLRSVGITLWTGLASAWLSWAGLAYELICFNHIQQILNILKLQAISCQISPWRYESEQGGAQIDLIIDRADRVLNLCEIKFSKADYVISKSEAMSLRNKIAALANHPNSKRKVIFPTFITTYGLKNNEYVQELVQNQVTMDDLFL